MNFDLLWQEMTLALREPALLSAGESADGVDRFHAWYDAGGDGKPEAIWTKPLQGKKQVRLPHHRDDFLRVYHAINEGSHAPAELRDLVLRGHYLYTLMRRHGWTPPSASSPS